MGHTTGAQATDGWYSEISYWAFVPGNGTGNSNTTRHFTAMVWKGVRKLGCGLYASTKIWVCRYKAGDMLDDDTPNTDGMAEHNPLRSHLVGANAPPCNN